jgi:RNA polymerase sigma-70 factor (ECF subfamily)
MDSDDRLQRERLLRRAVISGDEQAWQSWYEESFDRLYRYVSWRCGGLSDPTDEIVQETWLTAVRRIKDFDPQRAPFRVWLRGIAANLIRNHFRKRQRSGLVVQLPDDGSHAAGNGRADRQQRESAENVAASLASLPESAEAVLRAKYLNGQTVDEIADEYGRTPKAVESQLSRAREMFRQAYERILKVGS